jgi:hypothetical protein
LLLYEYQLELCLQQQLRQHLLEQDLELLFFEFALLDFVEQL